MISCFIFFMALASCRSVSEEGRRAEETPLYFTADSSCVVSISPYDGHRDSLRLDRPCSQIVCLSSTHVAYLDAVDADSTVVGVSGLPYISNPEIQKRAAAGQVWDVGYDAALDYERLLALHPDVILAYTVSAMKPLWLDKLQDLGFKVLVLYDNMEEHPLARAAYIRVAGALTGRLAAADSVYQAIAGRYHQLASSVRKEDRPTPKVLLNIPYNDQWYIPGKDNYMTRLIEDAGGEVLGAQPGQSESSIISLEEAALLSQEADLWLNTGWCRTREQLYSIHPLFGKFGNGPVFNNVKRTSAGGGNDFWEQGAARPDLILSDLTAILQSVQKKHPDPTGQDAWKSELHFYIAL